MNDEKRKKYKRDGCLGFGMTKSYFIPMILQTTKQSESVFVTDPKSEL